MAFHPFGGIVRNRSEFEQSEIDQFLVLGFRREVQPGPLSSEETEVLNRIETEVKGAFSTMKYLLGLTNDFAMLAQQIDVDGTSESTWNCLWK
jgi:hypothetical protein